MPKQLNPKQIAAIAPLKKSLVRDTRAFAAHLTSDSFRECKRSLDLMEKSLDDILEETGGDSLDDLFGDDE